MSAVVDMRGISRVYETGRLQVAALRGVDLHIDEGEFVAIVGPVRVRQVDADAHHRLPGPGHGR